MKSKNELESTIVRLEEAIAANNTDTRCFEADLKIAKRKLEDINKPELTPLQFDLIQEAIERIFKVKVSSVRVMNIKGSERRVGRNVGRKADWKKAIVRLAPGEKIEFFEGI